MNAHTPAPWLIELDHATNAPELIRASINNEMYDIASVLCDETESAAANARLIAASPILLDACRCALADLEGLAEAECFSLGDPAHQTIKELRAAIAKATGEAA